MQGPGVAGAWGIRRHRGSESLGEDALTTLGVVAEKAADTQSNLHGHPTPGYVGNATPVAAMNSSRALLAEGTRGARLSHRHD